MGNSLACFSEKNQATKVRKHNKNGRSFNGNVPPPCISRSTSRKSDRIYPNSLRFDQGKCDDDFIREQARVAAALLLQHHQQNGTLSQFERSVSLRDNLTSSRKQNRIPRSSSCRARSLSDSIPQHLELLHQGTNVENLKNKHFVLVHGGGFGAWCWYKTTTLLKEAGYQVDAIDLTGSGAHFFDSNNITTLSQYVKPLTDFLENLGDDKKVILVGHDIGGACISYAMELYPSKVSAAIFVAAAMLKNGQNILDMFSVQLGLNNLCQRAQVFRYANGKNEPPTAIDYDKSLLKEVLFNQTPTKDVELASVSMRQVPFGPLTEKLSLSATNYGSIPRFYVKTQDDFAIPASLQEVMIDSNQPEQVFQIKGSDHSPFLSKPQSLHKILVEISNIPPKMNLKTTI
ncbi:PREDICTED: putative methylesterase 11, chloroplastic isoform X2 [Nicotiana attenuata]|uniref:Methylesterase 11, chloroplastic n=1 Tax=Nicotiana attenuata TaxID=49451 RepID=A0A1J6I820_NICAT|nr:PREDICTED: putative methylesterase 11, chloroplastic isoform X2 [Nicotiana attenuata]OIS96695.1 putative methylesterase 11, chloroplastic [Nicotiana attenuata]